MANKPVSLNEKLDMMLKNQQKILENEKKILGEETKLEDIENAELSEENIVEKDEEGIIDELSMLEKEIKSNASNPIKTLTKRDLGKGFIGAFVGVMGHFAFTKAAEIAPTLGVWRSTVLYIVAFLLIILMLYYTGFRNVEKHIVLRFMPMRAAVLYGVSIVTIFIVNLLFGKIHFPLSFVSVYNLVGASIILSVLGAGTADLIGRGE